MNVEKSTEEQRILFTEEMKREYTILVPMMIPTHFEMIEGVMRRYGYKAELLRTTNREIALEGLKDVHNDTCYPALLVIGQMMQALKSGKYDISKVALMITQTGGGCRASNYIALLRKALKRCGYGHIPVISLNVAGLEKNPGFKLAPSFVYELLGAAFYGDVLMNVSNQMRPYEMNRGETDTLLDKYVQKYRNSRIHVFGMKKQIDKILSDFAAIKTEKRVIPKVGVVGEIYVKYAPLGNNSLEEFLRSEDVEVVMPPLFSFLLYSVTATVTDAKMFGMKRGKGIAFAAIRSLLLNMERTMIGVFKKYPQFRTPSPFTHIEELVEGYVSKANKMGEGFMLTGEMLELVSDGIDNVICTQPFGCLPNHIVAKGMIRKITENNPNANIVAIDYDPGASRINQENRIKLMLSNARIRLKAEKS